MNRPNNQPAKSRGGRNNKIENSTSVKSLSGAEGLEVDNLILKYNEQLPKCGEIMEKYKEVIKEENEVLLNAVKEEFTITQQYVIEQNDLLAVFDAVKNFNDAVEKYQNESFERQKHTLVEYLECLQATLEIINDIRKLVKDYAEAVIYEDYINEFEQASEEQITNFEVQCYDRKVLAIEKSDEKNNINDRVARLLNVYKANIDKPNDMVPESSKSPKKPQTSMSPEKIQKKKQKTGYYEPTGQYGGELLQKQNEPLKNTEISEPMKTQPTQQPIRTQKPPTQKPPTQKPTQRTKPPLSSTK